MKFNTKKESTKTTNLAGGIAKSMKPEQELVHAVLTSFLDDKFYESGSDRLNRIVGLVKQCKPQFVANLAIIARTEFHLRSVAHVLAGELAKTVDSSKYLGIVKDTIIGVCERPDDMLEIASYLGTPLTKQAKRGLRNAILKFSPYQLAKYKGEGKEISLVDLFNLVHPKVQHATREQKNAWQDLMEGKLTSFDTWETEISNAKDDKARTKAWEKLILENKLGYMATLRNINNFVKYDISDKARAAVLDKLTDPEEVLNSKQLPFRFTTAYENVEGDRKYRDAISEAMDIAVSNVPKFKGNCLIAVDTSGSMMSGAIDKASVFAAALYKANPSSDIVLYDTSIKSYDISGRMPVIDIATEIKNRAHGGGTETSLVFQYALAIDKKYNRIIILSDNESWSERYYGSSVLEAYDTFKKETGEDPFIYAVDIEGYGTKDVDGKKVFHLTGWSDRLLDFIGYAEKGEDLIDYIRDYK
jgi:60 kDa SS-A/Ro ribonucleoprotein